MGHLKKLILTIAGSFCVVFGFLGIFLPILPTTPFLLLASVLFLRSSDRLYQWLMNHRILGEYIHNYLIYKAIKKNTKIAVLLFLWLSLLLSFFITSSIYLKIILILVGIGVSFHIVRLKTIKNNSASIENHKEEL